MNKRLTYTVTFLLSCITVVAETVYNESFSDSAIGSEPDDFFIMNGDFTVDIIDGDAALMLSGTPVGEHGALFGSRAKEDIKVSMRIFASKRKRTLPAFALGLNGQSGAKLVIKAASRKAEMVLNDEIIASIPFTWKSDTWTHLSFSVTKENESEWLYSADITDISTESHNFSARSLTPPRSGKPSLWGFAYSEHPIYFDDIIVDRLNE